MGIPEIPPPNPIGQAEAMVRHQQQIAALLAAGLITPLAPLTEDRDKARQVADRQAERVRQWEAIRHEAVAALEGHVDPIARRVLRARYAGLLAEHPHGKTATYDPLATWDATHRRRTLANGLLPERDAALAANSGAGVLSDETREIGRWFAEQARARRLKPSTPWGGGWRLKKVWSFASTQQIPSHRTPNASPGSLGVTDRGEVLQNSPRDVDFSAAALAHMAELLHLTDHACERLLVRAQQLPY